MKYQNENPFAKLHQGEPWFFLRAQDKLSILLLYDYRSFLVLEGVPDEDLVDLDATIQEFIRWQQENKSQVKMPD